MAVAAIVQQIPLKRLCSCGCGEEIPAFRSNGKPRRFKHRHYPRGAQLYNWKGGVTIHSAGYRLILKPDHPTADTHGYVPEHRLVMEQHIDRYIDTEKEAIHHINGIRDDNRIENLQLTTPTEHQWIHHKISDLDKRYCYICNRKQLQLPRGTYNWYRGPDETKFLCAVCYAKEWRRKKRRERRSSDA